jgi:hypothetical protein
MGKGAFASAKTCFILLIPLRSVITSEVRDLGSCLHYRYNRRKQTPRSLALLGMTRVF